MRAKRFTTVLSAALLFASIVSQAPASNGVYIDSFGLSESGHCIHWPSISTDEVYTVAMTEVLGGTWRPLASGISGTPPQNSYTTTVGQAAAYYRIVKESLHRQSSAFSQNPVGYVKITASNGFTLVRHDFETIDGSTNRTEDIFDPLPIGSTVWRYDISFPGWSADNKAGVPGVFEHWDGGIRANQHIIQRGDAYLLQVPGGGPYEVYLLGEVPGTNNNSETHDCVAYPGFTGYGYPYPVECMWDQTVMSSNLPIGATAWRYENGTGWLASNKSGVPGVFETWSDWNLSTGPTKLLAPGEGLLLQVSGGPYYATEVKPYDWP